jgi:HAE1 family hydrophobic/amphiphilic exporter-1
MRLRPILITTLTTVLGLVPLALGIGEGAELQQPLAITVIAGLGSSTLLTLGVIPAVYLVLTRLLERPGEGGGAAARPEAAPDADAAPPAPALTPEAPPAPAGPEEGAAAAGEPPSPPPSEEG